MLVRKITHFICAAVLSLSFTACGQPEGEKSLDSSNTNLKAERLNMEELRQRLTPEQFRVALENGTEPPFRNAYWNNKDPGIYVDIVSGLPLFSSLDKFDSGTGWPSFTRPLVKEEVVEVKDTSHGMVRTEVRSKTGNIHLGHVFPDGPAPTGLRYCINSASLRFIPVDKMQEEGFGQYLALFKKSE